MLLSDKIAFKPRVKRQTEHYILMKSLIHQEDITIIKNICT